VIYHYEYSGPPGQVQDYQIPSTPGSQLIFDFSTLDVPDVLEFIDHGLKFEIGNQILVSNYNSYHGYCEFQYDGSLKTIVTDDWNVPGNFTLNSFIEGGCMRLYYTVPDNECQIRIRISGNKLLNTVYELNVIDNGSVEPIIDTVIVPVCYQQNDIIESIDCHNILYQYIDFSIKDTPVITQPTCAGHHQGEIHFPDHPLKDLIGLDTGIYNIKISNGFCEKDFDIVIMSGKNCEYYIPNCFKPGSELNGEFKFFTPISIQYDLEIYDRWGEMIFNNRCISNFSGWDGGNFPPGVYIYKVRDNLRVYSGDVTLIR